MAVVHSWLIRNDHLILMVLALVVGCASGAAVVGFREVIGLIQFVFYGTTDERLASFVQTLPWWQVLMAPTVSVTVMTS